MVKNPKWYDKAKSLLSDGMSITEVSKEVGTSTAYLTMWLGTNAKAYRLRDAGPRYLRAIGFDTKPTVMQALKFINDNPWVVADLEAFMAEREFKPIKIFDGPNARDGLQIECSKKVAPNCLKKEDFYNTSGRTSPVHAGKVFRNHGWNVGGSFRADICPACLKHILTLRREKKPAELVKPVTPVATPVPVAPKTEDRTVQQNINYLAQPAVKPSIPVSQLSIRDLDKETKRLIDMELDKAYDKHKGGYLNGQSDQAVADRMKCMVEWVAIVREEFHGPNTSSDSLKIDFQRLEAMAGEVKEAEKRVLASLDRMADLDKATNERMAEFEKLRKAFQTEFNTTMAKVKAL